jgi:preprotein translocase subunit SecF
MQDITVVSMIFTTILALACLFLIISPLFKWDVYFHVSSMSQDNAATKEALLTTLNEIEFEYKMDKISHADYKNLKKQYETEVASIMKDEEQMIQSNVEKDLMDEVEKEIEAQMKTYKNKKGEGK